MNAQNPLLDTSYQIDGKFIPFDRIKTEHFAPAFEETIQRARENLKKLSLQTGEASFSSIIEGIEFFKEDLERVSSVFFNLLSANTNEEMQKLAKEVSPKLAELSNDLLLDANIFRQVKAVWDRRESLNLNLEQKRLLELTYKSFQRNGALLSESDKNKLREIDKKLSRLSHEFSDNVLKATNEYQKLVTEETDVKDLPKNVVEEARAAAEAKGHKQGWLFTLQFPSFYPLLQFCPNEALRKEVWLANSSKAMKDACDNRGVAKEIAELRHQRANLLGYESHAGFVLEERMAEHPEKVKTFLADLLNASYAVAKNDVDELKALKKELTGKSEFCPWDVAFYSEKLKAKKFNFSEEELRPYFPIEKVIDGVFLVANKLYGLKFKERRDIPVYHPDVKTFEVADERGALVGFFFADFFPRESKRAGGWMTTYREQGLLKGKVVRPHVSIVCNFTKPTASEPSLLTLDEVRTLFHEFGHSLHALLSQCTYPSLAGTNVYWDFVELPSQIMENWVEEKEALDLFAAHYKTGEKISPDFVDKIRKEKKFQAGLFSLRQLSFGFLDMAWHAGDPALIKDVEAFEEKVLAPTTFFPRQPGTSVSTSFSHIFAGGYSSGYYSYKWAEVLDADAFEFFKERGIFNSEVARSFRDEVLSRGGTEPPMELYKRFRGREPDPKALLRRDGLL